MIIIFRGTTGSGKSALTRLLQSVDFTPEAGTLNSGHGSDSAYMYIKDLWGVISKTENHFHVCSADDHFMENGEYKFNPALLGEAHATCMRKFAINCQAPFSSYLKNRDLIEVQTVKTIIIVDNTNCTIAEVSPYINLATAFGHELHVVTLVGDPLTAYRRNRHGAPYSSVLAQHLQLEKSILEWPPWFPQKIFPQ